MEVNKDTTLKELWEIKRLCVNQLKKSSGIKRFPCSECKYFGTSRDFEIEGIECLKPQCYAGGSIEPHNWILPIID